MRAMASGGATHARYAHVRRPRDLHVVCSACGARALATHPKEAHLGPIVADVASAWNDPGWRWSCERCGARREGLFYRQLPARFYRFEVGELEVWAHNRDHLLFLLALLGGEPPRGHPYAGLSTYVPGRWKRRGRRLAATLRARLAEAERSPARSGRLGSA